MITRTNPEINISFLVASREEMGTDGNKVCVCRKEGPYFSVAIHFTFSQTFSLLSYQLIELKLVLPGPVIPR